MKTRVRLSLALALGMLAAGLGSSCKSIPFFGGGFELEVRPMSGQTMQLQELYLIVSEQVHVSEALRSEELTDLLAENKIKLYTSFRQYRPSGETWELEFKANDNSLVTYEVDGPSLTVELSKKLLGSQGQQFSVVVLGFFGAEGFKHVTINQTTLDAGEDQLVEVGTAMLTVTAS